MEEREITSVTDTQAQDAMDISRDEEVGLAL